MRDTWWRSLLRHCATSRKVAGSIPDGATAIFYWHNPSCRTKALGLTKNLRDFLWAKAVGALGCQPYHLHVPTVLKSESFNLLEPSGPVQDYNGIALPSTSQSVPSNFIERVRCCEPTNSNKSETSFPHINKHKFGIKHTF